MNIYVAFEYLLYFKQPQKIFMTLSKKYSKNENYEYLCAV